MIPLAILLFLNAAFNVIVWPRFYKRVVQDPRARDAEGRPTAFFKVHVVLITIALVLALVSAIAGVAALAGAL
ncbi:SCO4848 family membrane protein [Microbacterium sp. GXF0217]